MSMRDTLARWNYRLNPWSTQRAAESLAAAALQQEMLTQMARVNAEMNAELDRRARPGVKFIYGDTAGNRIVSDEPVD